MNVPGRMPGCFPCGSRRSELEVMGPVLPSTPAPRLLLPLSAGPELQVPGDESQQELELGGHDKGRGRSPPKGTAFQPESISNLNPKTWASNVSDHGHEI